jgi:predicted amidohydrolase
LEAFCVRIGAYQFPVTGGIEENLRVMRKAAALAKAEGVRLLAFCECALTGYPPEKTESARAVDGAALERALCELQRLAASSGMYLLAGSVTRREGRHYNSALLFTPDGGAPLLYDKRALWGWDLDNFAPGAGGGIWGIDGYRFGVRICYEVRFPEYFRELYQGKVDFAVVLFSDISETDDLDRYELIKAHLRTRASELACPVLSVNDISLFQTAPTGVYDGDGTPVRELVKGREGLLVYDFERREPSFSGRGRKTVADRLTAGAVEEL